jgi:hypothetical protein
MGFLSGPAWFYPFLHRPTLVRLLPYPRAAGQFSLGGFDKLRPFNHNGAVAWWKVKSQVACPVKETGSARDARGSQDS